MERKDTCVLSIFRWQKEGVEKQIPDKTITSSFSGSIKAVISQEWSAHSCPFTLVVTVSSTPATFSTSLSLSLVCWFILDTSKHPSRQMRPLAATFQARIGPLYPESLWSVGWMFWMKLQKLRHKEKVKHQWADSNRGGKNVKLKLLTLRLRKQSMWQWILGKQRVKSHQVSDSLASESIMAVLSKPAQPLFFPPSTQHPWVKKHLFQALIPT